MPPDRCAAPLVGHKLGTAAGKRDPSFPARATRGAQDGEAGLVGYGGGTRNGGVDGGLLGEWAPPAEAAFPGANGKLVYVWSDSRLRTLLQMGEGLRPKQFAGRELSSSDLEAPDWSENGTRLAFSAEGPHDSSHDRYATDAEGENLVNLINSPSHDSGPAWFPSGKKIAFVGNEGGIFGLTLGEDGRPIGKPKLLTGG